MLKPSKTKARKGVAIFLVILILCSAFLEFNVLGFGQRLGHHFISVWIWCVAGSSILTRLIMRESPRDISFRWGGWTTTRAALIGTAFPLVAGLIAYGFSWTTGLAHFAVNEIPQTVFGISMAGSAAMRFCKYLLVSLIVGGFWNCRLALGEEIGWRGYMLTRLMDSGFPAPIFLSGLIWALWHTPLILSGVYPSVPHSILSIAVFVVDIIASGYVLAWLRVTSGSIWPCVWTHSVWNAIILGPFDGSTTGGGIWVGEGGLLTTFAAILFAIALYRIWPLHRQGSAPTQD